MKILLAVICLIVVFLLWLKNHMIRYYEQKLKDMNDGNIG